MNNYGKKTKTRETEKFEVRKRTSLKEQLKEVWRLGGLSKVELLRCLVKKVQKHDCLGSAAQLAYYFLFALFPFLLFLTSLLGYVPVPDLMDRILELLAKVVPEEALKLIQDHIRDLVSNPRGGLLSFGILTALWASSSAMTAIIETLHRAYGVQEGRPFWKVKGTAILLTLGLSILLITATILLIFGPQIGSWMVSSIGLGSIFEVTWTILRWPVIFMFLILAMAMIYYFAPDVEQEWKWITPGSVFAVIGWLITSLGFSYYVSHFGSYNKTYGSIGAVIVLLTWMYLTGFFILVGGEINAILAQAASEGEGPGEKKV
ncbi:MAG TPA: YihY/virulence factor BrkB family protein [Candidatus Limnocylindrales bacterium]|nr:YihY/virulence factor BrkB family protein [Candidatus Limnocylindrales bacterium]